MSKIHDFYPYTCGKILMLDDFLFTFHFIEIIMKNLYNNAYINKK